MRIPGEPLKCVVWDLDGTLWPEVAVELPPGHRPRVRPEARRAIATLAERGIVNSVASRTDPSVAAYLDADPDLAGRFVAGQLSWGDKSAAIRRIADQLGIDPAAMAFVDDDPFERAEVAALLPEVLVLAPAELYARLDTPAFRPAVVTEEARQRVARYRQEQRRAAAEPAAGPAREEFLRGCRMRLTVGPARPADLDRLAELVARTHRFNSTGATWDRHQLAGLVAADAADWFVPVARLSDRFGDYGLVGAALIERGAGSPGTWRLHLFTVSCRAAGRGVPAALLRWLLAHARRGGADRLLMDVRAQRANLELRVLLRRTGFRAAGDGQVVRATNGDLPAPVPWLEPVETQDRAVEEVLRRLLADALGVPPAVVARLPTDADLIDGPLPLGSLAGARLLAAVADRFAVDVAAEDLALECLASIATLRDFVIARLPASTG